MSSATQLEMIVMGAYAATKTAYGAHPRPVCELLGMESDTIKSIVRSLSRKNLISYRAPEAPVQEKQEVSKRTRSTSGFTNADYVRNRIAKAKELGEDEEVVVNYAIKELNMTRSLAKVYVKNNWSRV